VIRDFPCDCEKGPNHLISVIVFILAVAAVVFLMSKNHPTRVGIEEPNTVMLQKDERKD